MLRGLRNLALVSMKVCTWDDTSWYTYRISKKINCPQEA